MYPWQRRANRRRRMQRTRKAWRRAFSALTWDGQWATLNGVDRSFGVDPSDGRPDVVVYGFVEASAPASQASIAGMENATWSTVPGWHNAFVDLPPEVAFDRERREAWLRAADEAWEAAGYPFTNTVGGLSMRTGPTARETSIVEAFGSSEDARARVAEVYRLACAAPNVPDPGWVRAADGTWTNARGDIVVDDDTRPMTPEEVAAFDWAVQFIRERMAHYDGHAALVMSRTNEDPK